MRRDSEEPVNNTVAVIALGEDRATLVCAETPILKAGQVKSADVAAVISDIHRMTGLAVYVPLLMLDFERCRNIALSEVWERSPNSTVDWSNNGQGLTPIPFS